MGGLLSRGAARFKFDSRRATCMLAGVRGRCKTSVVARPRILGGLRRLFPRKFCILPSSIRRILVIPSGKRVRPGVLNRVMQRMGGGRIRQRRILSSEICDCSGRGRRVHRRPSSVRGTGRVRH